MGMSGDELAHVRRGALLHDIGKMGIPDAILLKPGPLTDEEWQVMRRHPTYAFEWLAPIAFLRTALEIPSCHHERWDGTGYPRGLKAEQIPLPARIFAAVDVWDAPVRLRRPVQWSGDPTEKFWTTGLDVLSFLGNVLMMGFASGVTTGPARVQIAPRNSESRPAPTFRPFPQIPS